ncbi:MAG: Fic family protein [Coriobacteriales bacterium]|jgi:Fic family protein|nr:Fic family protein [Coriobacteriales bacterium]
MKDRIYQTYHSSFSPAVISALREIDDLKRHLDSLSPLTSDAGIQAGLKSYDEAFLVRMTYHSNAIEGSTLSLADTAAALDGELVKNATAQEIYAAKGVFDGFMYARKMLGEGHRLSEELIKEIHERTALDIDLRLRGIYRTTQVYIKGSQTVPVAAHKLYTLMPDLVFAHNDSDIHPLLKASIFHVLFEGIHPFADGNGRTGRNILNYMLMQAGYPPVAIRHDKTSGYIEALEEWQIENDSDKCLTLVASLARSEIEARISLIETATNFEELR